MNARALVLPLVFAAAVLAVFYWFGLPALTPVFSPNPTPDASLASTYDALTLSYQDPVLGFSIRYPRGYPLETSEGQSALFYAPGFDGRVESFFWAVLNASNADPSQLSSVMAAAGARLLSSSTVNVNGAAVLRGEYELDFDNASGPTRIVQGLVPCGNYSLYLVASIPDSLSDDVRMADYTLYTARCGA